MTPRERAEKIVDEFITANHGDYLGFTIHGPQLTQAITAAIEAERERCAKVAEHLNGWGNDCGKGGHAAHIAAAIRAGEP